ncbi:tetratricopeptide repeat protein [Nocardia amamiensis]|uniref:Tetratricopeptide repeat protein n=1 Tax=Nocardia amamiensis TaxID=404578 RepID=A0ABS0CVQ3_9NOCA|nr:tetratricopeptide repeat protein [Nocardia amamiensis]
MLTQLLAERPGDIGARYALAVCQLDLGLRREARESLLQVVHAQFRRPPSDMATARRRHTPTSVTRINQQRRPRG